jgi:hypothetical protein
MHKGITFILFLAFCLVERSHAQDFIPTVIFYHGSYATDDMTHEPIIEASTLGPLFAGRGYIYLALFRRGVGLSKDQGLNSADLMENAFKQNGQDGRNEVQLQQLETAQRQDILVGLGYT